MALFVGGPLDGQHRLWYTPTVEVPVTLERQLRTVRYRRDWFGTSRFGYYFYAIDDGSLSDKQVFRRVAMEALHQ